MDNDPIGGSGQGPQIFISHTHDEVEITLAWKELIRATSDGRPRRREPVPRSSYLPCVVVGGSSW